MKKLIKVSKKKNWKPRVIRAALIMGGLIIVTSSVTAGLRLRSKQERRIKDLRQEVLSLEKKNLALKEEIKYRQTLEYVEKEAREKLKMTKEGETIVIIPDKPVSDRNENREEAKESWTTTLWRKIKNIFGKT